MELFHALDFSLFGLPCHSLDFVYSFRLCLLNHHIRFASLACFHSFTTLKPFILHTIYILIDILCIFVGFRHKTNINLNPLWIEFQVNTLWWKVLSDKCHVTFYIENRQRQTKTTACYNANFTKNRVFFVLALIIDWVIKVVKNKSRKLCCRKRTEHCNISMKQRAYLPFDSGFA